ncbi:MAG TPA: hypothetical protein VLF41_02515 [Candidatus Nanoarchaeia archaeon]|nr:hypothetical protein [Candidatus Nanoarchaeia archaeon]
MEQPDEQTQPAENQQLEEPGLSGEVLDSGGESTDAPLISWQASEYIHHDKKTGWYLWLVVGVVSLVGIGVYTQQWSAITVLAAMTAAVVVYARKAPRTLTYSLSDDGIDIEHKHYPFSQFRSFAVVSDVGWHTIDLDPIQRFMPRLTILFADDDLDKIVTVLSEKLPRSDRRPDAIERLSRYLKF